MIKTVMLSLSRMGRGLSVDIQGESLNIQAGLKIPEDGQLAITIDSQILESLQEQWEDLKLTKVLILKHYP